MLVIVLVLAVGGGVAGALLASQRSTSNAVSFPSTAPSFGLASPGVGPTSGKPAPDFSVRALDGRALSLADLRSHPTALYFMAYWCSDCLPGAQALGRIYSRYAAHGLRVLAVDIDPSSSPKLLREFAAEAGDPGDDFVLDDSGKTARAFTVRTLDTTVVIDRQGRLVFDGPANDYQTLSRLIAPVAA